MIIKLKNGSGIHIKKSHKGLFTKYCNGKVTNECIRRGKNSSDPKIRRRATFADNARHFKHRLGGSIVEALLGTKLELGENLTDEQLKNIEGVWNYLTQTKGVTPRNAAAIMGNVWQESRFLPLRVSSAGATGWMLFLGLRDKDYLKWLKTNEHHPDYGLFDYILYAILDPEHKHDFYRNDYERVIKNMKLFKLQGNTKAYNEYNTYKNKIYGAREKEGRLHFLNEVNTAFNNPNSKLNYLTTLWHDSIERSNPVEADIPTRIKAANAFYNYYSPKPDPLNIPNLYSGSILYHMKFGGTIKAQDGTKLTGWLKFGNFLNSNTGKSILNGVQQGLSYFSNKPKSTKADKETFIKNYITQNSVNPNLFYLLAYQELITSPDINASDIVAKNTAYKLALLYNSKLKNDANAAWALLLITQNSGQQSSNNIFGLASNIIGGIGLFIGNKSTSTDGLTATATTPEKAILTTASPKIPSVYNIAEKLILPIWLNILNPVSNIGWKQPL